MFSLLTSLFLLPTVTLCFPLAPSQLLLQSQGDSAAAPLLPTCDSSTFQNPCQCPEGTKYESTITYAVIGANAFDVRNLTGGFFHIHWLGNEPRRTEGPENVKGSTRTDYVTTMKGKYDFTEEGLYFINHPDGGFETAYKQQNSPIPYHSDVGPGAFAGELVTWKSEYLGDHETAITWGVYVCFTGGLLGFPEFHEGALNNATKLLDEQGKIKGRNVAPWSTAHSIPVANGKVVEL